MTAKRVDANQPSIVADLRAIGATVEHLHGVGGGCPDLVVGFQGANYLFEVKGPKGGVSVSQLWWHESWRGQVNVIRTSEVAFRIMGVKIDDE